MIIETSCNRFYRVWETNDADLAHIWFGVPVKRVACQWVDKGNVRPSPVRKAASRVVEA